MGLVKVGVLNMRWLLFWGIDWNWLAKSGVDHVTALESVENTRELFEELRGLKKLFVISVYMYWEFGISFHVLCRSRRDVLGSVLGLSIDP